MSEFSAVASNGQMVKIPYKESVDTLVKANPGMSYVGIGASATTAKFRDANGEFEYDIMDSMKEGGYKDVQYHVNAKDIRDSKNFIDASDVGVAYNLKAIKEDQYKRQYIMDMTDGADAEGKPRAKYTDAFHDGNDWFGIKDGYYYSLNNHKGFEPGNMLAEMAAGAGSMIVGTIGMIGAGIGATATGPGALAAAAMGGAAGSALGDQMQRGAEKLLGTDAGKYNSQMSLTEEAKNLGIEAGTGAVAGVLGQVGGNLLSRGVEAGAKAIAKTGFAEEYMVGLANKMQAGRLIDAMPSGWMANSVSKEQAAVKDVLSESLNKGSAIAEETMYNAKNIAGKKLSGGEMDNVISKLDPEIQAMARGSVKDAPKSMTEAQEAAWQKTARDTWGKDQVIKEQQLKTQAMEKANKDGKMLAYLPEFKGEMESAALNTYGATNKTVKTILNPEATIEATEQAQAELTHKLVNNVSNKVKVSYDDITGNVNGFDQESLAQYKRNTVEQALDDAWGYTKSLRKEIDLSNIPKDIDVNNLKGTTLSSLKNFLGQTQNTDIKVALSDLVSTISKQRIDTGKVTKESFDKFYEMVYKRSGEFSQHELSILTDAQESLMQYEARFMNNGALANRFMNNQSRLSTLNQGYKSGVFQDDVAFLSRLKDLESMSAGKLQVTPYTDELAKVSHIDDLLSGKINSVYRKFIDGDTLESHDAFTYLTKVVTAEGRKSAEQIAATTIKGDKEKGKEFIKGVLDEMKDHIPGMGVLKKTSELSKNAGKGLASVAAKKGAPLKAAWGAEEAVTSSKTKREVKNETPSILASNDKPVSAEEIISQKRLTEHKTTMAEFKRKEKEKAQVARR